MPVMCRLHSPDRRLSTLPRMTLRTLVSSSKRLLVICVNKVIEHQQSRMSSNCRISQFHQTAHISPRAGSVFDTVLQISCPPLHLQPRLLCPVHHRPIRIHSFARKGPITNISLPVTNPPIFNPHHHDSHVLSLNIRPLATIPRIIPARLL